VARSDTGWSAELRIPVGSLTYRDGTHEWGFNVERRVQRALETSRWASPVRDARFGQPSRAGRLRDLPEFTSGMGLGVRPAVSTRWTRPDPRSSRREAEPSLDLRQRLGSNLLLSLTANTDFAETEVDIRRTNLTRFPLFFPEKRTFFLEGSDAFEFGLPGEHAEVLPFFTRRIGLYQGLEVPLVVGGKLNGRVGRTTLGALAVRTGTEPGLPPPVTLGALRVRQDLLAESAFGLIATAGDPAGRAGSWTLGGDLTLRTSRLGGTRNLALGLWGLATSREGLVGDRAAYGAALRYPNDVLTLLASWQHVGAAFDPSLGFVPRRGVEILQAGTEVRHRRPVPFLREMFYQLHSELVLDQHRRWQSYNVFTAPFYLRFESGEVLEFNVMPFGERLVEPFEVAPGVAIPSGEYHWVRYRLEGTVAAKRRVSGRATWWFGSFYDGTLRQLQCSLVIKPSAFISVELMGQENVGHLPAGPFRQEVLGGRLRLGLSTDLQVQSLVQYDNLSRLIGANTRLRWQFHPLGEVFLVHNHNVADVTGRWRFESSELQLKVQYGLRR
jgi:hypothetical protein